MNSENSKLKNNYVKDLYDKIITSEYGDDYEFNRWFCNSRRFLDYVMMHQVISYHIKDKQFKNCLELGPGPGTWTRILYRKEPSAHYHLIDISEAMKCQFELEMRAMPNVVYSVMDFYEFDSDSNFDLFFSSRALEYIENSGELCQKIVSHMTEGGTGIIITKNPNHLRSVWNRRSRRKHHTGQICPTTLERYLMDAGCSEVSIYPVIIRIPHLERLTHFFSKRLFNATYKSSTKKLSRFAESYAIVFKR